METIDIVFIGIIVVNGIIAYRRGMVKTLFNFFSAIIALFLSYMFQGAVSELLINYTDIETSIQNRISTSLNLDSITEGVSSQQEQISLISDLELPNLIKDYLLTNNNSQMYSLLDVSSIADYISNMISIMLVNALGFLVCFIGFTLLIAVVSNLLDLIMKLPILKQLNRLMGLVIGVFTGVIINWIICLVLYVYAGLNGNSQLLTAVSESTVAQFFYNNNPILDIIMDVTKVFY